jgi:ribosomal protein S18 acetylase RimI-like enzyme
MTDCKKAMKQEIRPMTERDKPVIMRILENTPEFTPAEVMVAEEVIDTYLKDPVGSGYLTFVAVEESVVMGYVCYGPTPLTEGTWDIYWIAVDGQQQGKGTGRLLMASARIALIETSSKADYGKTQRFYDKLGYELICKVPDFYKPGDDKLILQKKFR